ncbi:MAG: FAD-dependent oxidoreductase [Betaproteobacteria bacterium]|nr:FAD-dependent oxidoreductase [Betaproteobacteria bacterium]
MVVANALDIAAHGGEVRTRTRVTGARRDGGLWRVALRTADGAASEIVARAIVNAAGPWVKRVLDSVRPEKPAGEGACAPRQAATSSSRACTRRRTRTSCRMPTSGSCS